MHIMVHWVQLKESSITEPILQAAQSTSQAQSNLAAQTRAA